MDKLTDIIYCVYISDIFSDNYNVIYCEKFIETKDSYILVPHRIERDKFPNTIRLLYSDGFVCGVLKVPVAEVLYWNPKFIKFFCLDRDEMNQVFDSIYLDFKDFDNDFVKISCLNRFSSLDSSDNNDSS